MKLVGLLASILVIVAGGCSPLVLKPADFSWPVESKLIVGPHGIVKEHRYSISFNVKPLLYAETKDTTSVAGRTLWIIRDKMGYYYITGPGFKDVFIFKQGGGGLVLKKQIEVSKVGLDSPSFNQRDPYIELISSNEKTIMLTANGIRKETSK